jgi:hypothetical protein
LAFGLGLAAFFGAGAGFLALGAGFFLAAAGRAAGFFAADFLAAAAVFFPSTFAIPILSGK